MMVFRANRDLHAHRKWGGSAFGLDLYQGETIYPAKKIPVSSRRWTGNKTLIMFFLFHLGHASCRVQTVQGPLIGTTHLRVVKSHPRWLASERWRSLRKIQDITWLAPHIDCKALHTWAVLRSPAKSLSCSTTKTLKS